jgi:hypothetical protein
MSKMVKETLNSGLEFVITHMAEVKGVEDIQFLFSKAGTDENIANLYLYLSSKPELKKDLDEVWSEIAPFYEYTNHRLLKVFAETQMKKNHKDEFYSKYCDRDISGVQLTNASKTKGAIFSPDASEPGKFRVTLFDESGFYSHETRNSFNDLLNDVWQMGFREEIKGLLEELSSTQKWVRGSEQTTLIHEYHCGKISLDDYHDKSAKLAARNKIADLLVSMDGEDEQSIMKSIESMLQSYGYSSTTLSVDIINKKPKAMAFTIAEGLIKIEKNLKMVESDTDLHNDARRQVSFT